MLARNQIDLEGRSRMDAPRVCISYAHVDERWKDSIAQALGAAGLDVWHDRKIPIGEAWHPTILDAIDTCDAVVCVITKAYLASGYVQTTEIPAIQSRRVSSGLFLIPILVEPCAWGESPWLTPTQMFPPDGRSVTTDYADRAREFFGIVAERILARFHQAGSSAIPWRKPVAVELASLRRSDAAVVGRESLFDDLDNDFNSPNVHAAALIGAAGMGKSTVLGAWLQRLSHENYRYAVRVFGWSFDMFGGEESSRRFVDDLFRFFAQETPVHCSPWEIGNRLARLVRREPSLLVLDGVESLLAGVGSDRPFIRDPAIARLLAELARDNRGLLVVASRQPIPELNDFTTAVQHELALLSPEAGASILAAHGLADERLAELSAAFGNHALALSLLAGYVGSAVTAPGEAALRAIPPFDPSHGAEGHARRVLQAFRERLQHGPELQVLESIALAGGAADAAALAALRRAGIHGLSHRLTNLSDAACAEIVAVLQARHLILPTRAQAPEALELHPIVRDYFTECVRELGDEVCQAGHQALYRHYRSVAPPLPNTADEMQPLYHALRHGCKAGLQQEALDDVFWRRILRGNQQFSWRVLGMVQSDLGAIAHFFTTDEWTGLSAGIKETDAGFVIGQAAIYLGMTGRLTEAAPLLRQSVERDHAAQRFANASVTAGNLSHVLLLLGDIAGAIEAARKSVACADSARDQNERRIARVHLGHALSCASQMDDAIAQFVEAETILRDATGEVFLYGDDGRVYGELLIACGRWSDAQARATRNLSHPMREPHSEAREQDLIAAARANLAGFNAGADGDLTAAHDQAESALEMLRELGQLDILPAGLLTRAEVYRAEFRPHEALVDLEEALALCERCHMRLPATDAFILQAQVLAEMGRRQAAHESIVKAQELTKELNYRVRDQTVANTLARLGNKAAEGRQR